MSTPRCLALLLVALTVAGHASAQQPADPVPLGTPGLTLPRLVKEVMPVYPSIAQAARVDGRVVIEATVDEGGRVQGARVIRSIPLLDQAALDATRQLQFVPAAVQGRPVPVVTSITFRFQLIGNGSLPAAASPALGSTLLPHDFALVYWYRCSRFRVFLDTTRRMMSDPASLEPLRHIVDIDARELEAIYLRMIRAGYFDGDGSRREVAPGFRDGPNGIDVVVLGHNPVVDVRSIDGPPMPPSIVHSLDVRTHGVWRFRAWSEPLRGEKTEEVKELSAVGALIRRIVERQDAIKALPRDQRSCG